MQIQDGMFVSGSREPALAILPAAADGCVQSMTSLRFIIPDGTAPSTGGISMSEARQSSHSISISISLHAVTAPVAGSYETGLSETFRRWMHPSRK